MPSCHLSSRSIRATRKIHRCNWCGQTIEKGKPAEYSFGIFENEPSGGYMHRECNLAYSHESQTTNDFDYYWSIGKFERGGFKDEWLHTCGATYPMIDDALMVLQQMYVAPREDTPALNLYSFTKGYALISELYNKYATDKSYGRNFMPNFTLNFKGELLVEWRGRNDWNYIRVYLLADSLPPDFIYVASVRESLTNERVTPRTLSKYLNWLFKK